MSRSADESWAENIATPLYEMLDRGASDEDVDQFLRARRVGDIELAQHLFSKTRLLAPPTATSRTTSNGQKSLTAIRVAALRPVVNELAAQDLLFYIDFVGQASALLVAEHANEDIWACKSAVEAAGSSLSNAALKWLSSKQTIGSHPVEQNGP